MWLWYFKAHERLINQGMGIIWLNLNVIEVSALLDQSITMFFLYMKITQSLNSEIE